MQQGVCAGGLPRRKEVRALQSPGLIHHTHIMHLLRPPTCSCSLVTAGNVSAAGSGQVAAAAIRGGLAPLPFESLRNAPESQLRCFRGGLGQATDTYNVSSVLCVDGWVVWMWVFGREGT